MSIRTYRFVRPDSYVGYLPVDSYVGLIVEFPGVLIDRFKGDNLKSTVYFLSHWYETHTLIVTFMPAGHCPGSVMFLLVSKEKSVLFTGDFRWQPSFKPCPHGSVHFKTMWSIFVTKPACYGYEFLMKELALRFNTKVHVSLADEIIDFLWSLQFKSSTPFV
ncbi:protein artemis-like [Symsagittifera roscoffensis]|uniref:protein artemis-like n=1 Tax=Symsagittifera roscoffensis TaxID=84072 RepID=UPI00307C0958